MPTISSSSSPRLELALLRKSVWALTARRENCVHCHRTPLVGERVYLYGQRLVCELCRPLRRGGPRALAARPLAGAQAGGEGATGVVFRRPWTPSSSPSRSTARARRSSTTSPTSPNHPEFTDHYLKDWRLTREDSYGRGAGARYRVDAPRNRFAWSDMTFIEVERPHRIVAVGRGGKYNRIKTFASWTLPRRRATAPAWSSSRRPSRRCSPTG